MVSDTLVTRDFGRNLKKPVNTGALNNVEFIMMSKILRNSSSFFNEIGIEIVLMLYHYND